MGRSQGLGWKATASILALVAQGERCGRRGSACSGVRDYWGRSRRKSSPLHALVGAVRCEGVCRGSERLWQENPGACLGRDVALCAGGRRCLGQKVWWAETKRGRSSRSFFTLLQMRSGCDRFHNHTRSLLKMAATYSPTVTQYHRHNWA